MDCLEVGGEEEEGEGDTILALITEVLDVAMIRVADLKATDAPQVGFWFGARGRSFGGGWVWRCILKLVGTPCKQVSETD